MSIKNLSLDSQEMLIRVIDLLLDLTAKGTLEWHPAFGVGFKTNLDGQTVVVEPDRRAAAFGQALTESGLFDGVSLEIRDSRGELALKVEPPNRQVGVIEFPALYTNDIHDRVSELYSLIKNKKDSAEQKALVDVLTALEKRNRR